MKLSILTPTLPSRKHLLKQLKDKLEPQLGKYAEHIALEDDGQKPTGAKRNELLQLATGEYISFVDDDDLVSSDYVSLIMQAAESGPDVVGIRGLSMVDNEPTTAKPFEHSIKHNLWYTHNGVAYRFPNHLNPVKRLIALENPFPRVTLDEDFAYSMRLKNSGMLKTEVFIPSSIYLYLQRTKKGDFATLASSSEKK